jgi:hypothetical protein
MGAADQGQACFQRCLYGHAAMTLCAPHSCAEPGDPAAEHRGRSALGAHTRRIGLTGARRRQLQRAPAAAGPSGLRGPRR